MGIDVLGIDILGIDILGIDILAPTPWSIHDSMNIQKHEIIAYIYILLQISKI